MLVYKEQVEAYRIGTKLFVVDDEGFLREVGSGRTLTDKEWRHYRKYEKDRFETLRKQESEEKRMQEEYEKQIQKEEERHEEEKARIHFQIFGN